MLYKAKVAVCSYIHTKHSTQRERHVEFFNVRPWWYVKKPLGVKRLKRANYKLAYLQVKFIHITIDIANHIRIFSIALVKSYLWTYVSIIAHIQEL
jgi:hypothetical protein